MAMTPTEMHANEISPRRRPCSFLRSNQISNLILLLLENACNDDDQRVNAK